MSRRGKKQGTRRQGGNKAGANKADPTPSRHGSDADALRSLRKGDEAGFEKLVDSWADDVNDHVRRSGIEPDARDAMVEAIFRDARARVIANTDETFGTAVMATAVEKAGRANHSIDSRLQPSARTAGKLSRGTDPKTMAEDSTIRTMIWDSASVLGPNVTEILDLRWRHQLEPDQIAAILSVDQARVEDIINKAPHGLAASVRTRLLWAGGKPEHLDLADELQKANATEFDPKTVRVIHRHVRSCAVCRSRSMIAIPVIDIFGGIPLEAPDTDHRSRLVAALTGAAVGAAIVSADEAGADEAPADASPGEDTSIEAADAAADTAADTAGDVEDKPVEEAEEQHADADKDSRDEIAEATVVAATADEPAAEDYTGDAPDEPAAEDVPDEPVAEDRPEGDEGGDKPEDKPDEPAAEDKAEDKAGDEGDDKAADEGDDDAGNALALVGVGAGAGLVGASLDSSAAGAAEVDATEAPTSVHEPVKSRADGGGGGPRRSRRPLIITGAAAAVVVVLLIIVALTRGGDDDSTEVNVASASDSTVRSTTTSRPGTSSTSTTASSTTVTTTAAETPTTSSAAPPSTAADPAPAPPTTEAPLSFDVGFNVQTGRARPAIEPNYPMGNAVLVWDVTVNRPADVEITGPGFSGSGLSGSASVCPGGVSGSTCTAAPGFYYYRIIVRVDGAEITQQTATLQILDR